MGTSARLLAHLQHWEEDQGRYRPRHCAQCGRVKEEEKGSGKHVGPTGWKSGQFCPYAKMSSARRPCSSLVTRAFVKPWAVPMQLVVMCCG